MQNYLDKCIELKKIQTRNAFKKKKIIIMFAAIQLARKTVERQRRTMLNEY